MEFPLVWTAEMPPKGPEYFKNLREECSPFISGHELLPLPSVIETMAAKTIYLLTDDVKSKTFMAVSREAMEEALKDLNIGVKLLVRRSNAMSDILLATEKAAK